MKACILKRVTDQMSRRMMIDTHTHTHTANVCTIFGTSATMLSSRGRLNHLLRLAIAKGRRLVKLRVMRLWMHACWAEIRQSARALSTMQAIGNGPSWAWCGADNAICGQPLLVAPRMVRETVLVAASPQLPASRPTHSGCLQVQQARRRLQTLVANMGDGRCQYLHPCTCFASTKVQILTPEELGRLRVAA